MQNDASHESKLNTSLFHVRMVKICKPAQINPADTHL